MRLVVYMIIQRLYIDSVNGFPVDNDEVSLGFVTKKWIAEQFCEKHSNCHFQEIVIDDCPQCLEDNMVDLENDDVVVVSIPMLLPDDVGELHR